MDDSLSLDLGTNGSLCVRRSTSPKSAKPRHTRGSNIESGVEGHPFLPQPDFEATANQGQQHVVHVPRLLQLLFVAAVAAQRSLMDLWAALHKSNHFQSRGRATDPVTPVHPRGRNVGLAGHCLGTEPLQSVCDVMIRATCSVVVLTFMFPLHTMPSFSYCALNCVLFVWFVLYLDLCLVHVTMYFPACFVVNTRELPQCCLGWSGFVFALVHIHKGSGSHVHFYPCLRVEHLSMDQAGNPPTQQDMGVSKAPPHLGAPFPSLCECSNACFPPGGAPRAQNHAHMHIPECGKKYSATISSSTLDNSKYFENGKLRPVTDGTRTDHVQRCLRESSKDRRRPAHSHAHALHAGRPCTHLCTLCFDGGREDDHHRRSRHQALRPLQPHHWAHDSSPCKSSPPQQVTTQALNISRGLLQSQKTNSQRKYVNLLSRLAAECRCNLPAHLTVNKQPR